MRGVAQRAVVYDEEREKQLRAPPRRTKKLEESPKGMLDTPQDMTPSEWLKMNSKLFPALFLVLLLGECETSGLALPERSPSNLPSLVYCIVFSHFVHDILILCGYDSHGLLHSLSYHILHSAR